jgi:hypothetical protein
MSRFNQVIALAGAGLAVFQSAAHAVVPLGEPLGVTLGASLGTALPFAGGGVLGVAAAAVVAGIFIKRHKR